MAILGSVQDRPLDQLHGRERLRYTGRRMRAHLNVLLIEPRKLGIYPSLYLLPVIILVGLGSAFVLDVVLPGPRLGVGFFLITGVVLLVLLVVAIAGVVALFGLEPICGRQAWQLTTIQTDVGHAAFRHRLDPDRGSYELADLWTINRGAKLGFGRIVPYLVDKLGDEPMHLTAATAKLARVYEEHGFRPKGARHGWPLHSWPFRNYRIPMTRPPQPATSPPRLGPQ